MHPINNKNKLFSLLTEGAMIVTPNNRLSARFLHDYYHYQQKQTIDKPQCMPYKSIAIGAFQHYHHDMAHLTPPTLINHNQILFIWREIIQATKNITYTDGLLHAVITAWEQVELWGVNPEDPHFGYTNQTRQFQRWWITFRARLTQLHLITEHQIIHYLIEHQFPISLKPLIWCCFDDFTPQQRMLQDQLLQQDIPQFLYDLTEIKTTAKQFAANDDKEEFEQLILWLQDQLLVGKQRIGIVIPDLQQRAKLIQRQLQTHFEANTLNISLGQPLREYPLVSHALQWLNLNHQDLSHQQLCLLLQSPYVGQANEEFLARAQCLQDSPLIKELKIPFTQALSSLQQAVPKLGSLLAEMMDYPKMASPQEWVMYFQDRLNRLGFPGDYGLGSETYQCYQRFAQLFDELRQLSLIRTELSSEEALAAIQQLAENTIFQAQTVHASIHVSGLLEASGLEFDCLWVMGLTDQCLPQKTQRSPFIPAQLQSELLMPHSSPDKELALAKKIIHRFQAACEELVFSYPKWLGDNPNLPCAFIKDFPAYSMSCKPVNNSMANQLISIDESYLVELDTHEPISGGTSLLANQAKCPFKAFADHRLRAKTNTETTEGLDPKERGQLIHKVLELFWQKVESSERLIQMEQSALDAYIDESIHSAIKLLNANSPTPFSDVVKDIEFQRLKRLVLACLEWEKKRQPFTPVALEQAYQINLGGLEINLRVDRLDQVGESKWVIDYKTNLPAIKPWNEERPKEPQLLLYSLLEEDIDTFLFIQLNNGSIQCSGLSAEKHPLPGISTVKKGDSWDAARERWREQLTVLAHEFQQGHCPPQPATPAICEQCDFQNLCRFQVIG